MTTTPPHQDVSACHQHGRSLKEEFALEYLEVHHSSCKFSFTSIVIGVMYQSLVSKLVQQSFWPCDLNNSAGPVTGTSWTCAIFFLLSILQECRSTFAAFIFENNGSQFKLAQLQKQKLSF